MAALSIIRLNGVILLWLLIVAITINPSSYHQFTIILPSSHHHLTAFQLLLIIALVIIINFNMLTVSCIGFPMIVNHGFTGKLKVDIAHLIWLLVSESHVKNYIHS